MMACETMRLHASNCKLPDAIDLDQSVRTLNPRIFSNHATLTRTWDHHQVGCIKDASVSTAIVYPHALALTAPLESTNLHSHNPPTQPTQPTPDLATINLSSEQWLVGTFPRIAVSV